MNGLSAERGLPVVLPANPAERLSVLFDTHYDRLYRLSRRLTNNVDDALDLVQETFLKAARSPATIPVGSVKEEAWLVRVLINTCHDQQRKAAVRQRHDRGVTVPTSMESDQEATLIARATVWRALDTLTPRRRAILVLHELEGLPIPAIASLLGIAAVTVRWHLSMGRRALARILRPQMGGTNEER